ncbi:hypothetical protein KKI24_07130 [bacterium]|nr:hypothetical protein [bacterium]
MKDQEEIKVKRLDKSKTTLKVKVIVTKQFKIRAAIAIGLVKLAAKVLGSGVEIETIEEK